MLSPIEYICHPIEELQTELIGVLWESDTEEINESIFMAVTSFDVYQITRDWMRSYDWKDI